MTNAAKLPHPLFDPDSPLGHLSLEDQAKITGGNLARLVTV
jgi:hypothetical protein